MQECFRLNICKHTFGLILSPCEIRPFPPSILFVCPRMRGGASAGFSLSLKCERRQSKALPRTHSRTRSKKKTAGLKPAYTFLNFFVFYEIRPFPPLILLSLSVYVRRSLGRIFAVAQMRTTAKPCFAAYSLEDSLQTKKEQARPVLFLFGAGNEIRTRDICLGKATLYH